MIKSKIIAILFAILLVLILIMTLYIGISHGKIALKDEYKALYESAFKVPISWQAKDSYNHSRVETIVVSDPKIVQELAGLRENFDGLQKNMNNLIAYNKVSTETTIHKRVIIKDSIATFITKYDSLVVHFKGDSAQLDGKVKIVLEEVETWHRRWFLGKKRVTIEFRSEDPNTIIKINKSIIKDKKFRN